MSTDIGCTSHNVFRPCVEVETTDTDTDSDVDVTEKVVKCVTAIPSPADMDLKSKSQTVVICNRRRMLRKVDDSKLQSTHIVHVLMPRVLGTEKPIGVFVHEEDARAAWEALKLRFPLLDAYRQPDSVIVKYDAGETTVGRVVTNVWVREVCTTLELTGLSTSKCHADASMDRCRMAVAKMARLGAPIPMDQMRKVPINTLFDLDYLYFATKLGVGQSVKISIADDEGSWLTVDRLPHEPSRFYTTPTGQMQETQLLDTESKDVVEQKEMWYLLVLLGSEGKTKEEVVSVLQSGEACTTVASGWANLCQTMITQLDSLIALAIRRAWVDCIVV